jgi:hypothetical protein
MVKLSFQKSRAEPAGSVILLQWYSTVLYCSGFLLTVQYCTVQYITLMYSTVLYCTVPAYSTVLYRY